jgi:hypothetical protein
MSEKQEDMPVKLMRVGAEWDELRDRFAAAALTGIIASPVHERMPYAFAAARCAYEYADAMLKARDNKSTDQ